MSTLRKLFGAIIMGWWVPRGGADRDSHIFPWRLTPSIDEADLGMLDDQPLWDAFAANERLRHYYGANVVKPLDPSKIIYPDFPVT